MRETKTIHEIAGAIRERKGTRTLVEKRDVPGLLKAAAALVDRALVQLNLEETSCDECGRRIFQNWEHAKIAERIEPSVGKLRAAARSYVDAKRNGDATQFVCKHGPRQDAASEE